MKTVTPSSESKYSWFIVVQCILYGIMDVVSKKAYQTMDVYCFLFIRYTLASLAMLLLWGKGIIADLKKTNPLHYVIPALCMSLAFVFSNLALKNTSATNMTFIRSLAALIAPLLSLIFFGQRYRKLDLVLQFSILVGLYLLCAKGGLGRFGLGETFALISATLVAGTLVFGKSALDYIDAKTLTFVQISLAVLFCGIAAFATGGMDDIVLAVEPRMVLYLSYASLGCTVIGYLLQNVALIHISAKQVGIVQCLYPIVTALIAFFVLGERLTALGMIGAGIIIACVVLENAR